MRVPALLLLAACQPGADVVLLEGASFEWDLFNHRLSTLQLAVDEDEARVAVVGGTSTTGQIPGDEQKACEDACDEFPFRDTSHVALSWVRGRVPGGLGRAEIELVAGPQGASEVLRVPLQGRARGEPVAVITGLGVDTDLPLRVESCYDPAFGWMPRRVAVRLGQPVVVDDAVEVPVEAFFEAGLSLEHERVCIDKVADEALAAVRVGVAAMVLRNPVESVTLEHGMAFGYGSRSNPDPQPPPDLADRPFPAADDLAASFTALDWRFHEQDEEDRGAYLRSLWFEARPDEGWALGHATNYSPFTQLSGFDYHFEGEAVLIPLRGLERGTLLEEVPAEIDEHGVPTLFTFPL